MSFLHGLFGNLIQVMDKTIEPKKKNHENVCITISSPNQKQFGKDKLKNAQGLNSLCDSFVDFKLQNISLKICKLTILYHLFRPQSNMCLLYKLWIQR